MSTAGPAFDPIPPKYDLNLWKKELAIRRPDFDSGDREDGYIGRVHGDDDDDDENLGVSGGNSSQARVPELERNEVRRDHYSINVFY